MNTAIWNKTSSLIVEQPHQSFDNKNHINIFTHCRQIHLLTQLQEFLFLSAVILSVCWNLFIYCMIYFVKTWKDLTTLAFLSWMTNEGHCWSKFDFFLLYVLPELHVWYKLFLFVLNLIITIPNRRVSSLLNSIYVKMTWKFAEKKKRKKVI